MSILLHKLKVILKIEEVNLIFFSDIECIFQKLNSIPFSLSAKILRENKDIFSYLLNKEDKTYDHVLEEEGFEVIEFKENAINSYYSLLDDCLYPSYNMKLFYLCLHYFDTPQNETYPHYLLMSSFFADNMKAYKFLESKVDKVDYIKIFKIMKNSNPYSISCSNIGNITVYSESFLRYIEKKINDEELQKLKKFFDIKAENVSDFIFKFLLLKIHSWSFIFYLNEKNKQEYSDIIAEKIQFLSLHSKQSIKRFLPTIIKFKLLNKDNFMYEFLFKKNNNLLLNHVMPDFYENINNIHVYTSILEAAFEYDIKLSKNIDFFNLFLDNKSEKILKRNIIVLKKYLMDIYPKEINNNREKYIKRQADSFLLKYLSEKNKKAFIHSSGYVETINILSNELLCYDVINDVKEENKKKRL